MIGYVIQRKSAKELFLASVRNDGIVHTLWNKGVDWLDCAKKYKSKDYAEKVAKMVEGKVLKVEYQVDELGVVPFSVKIIA